jgi:purine-cytosine permease-like protein
MVRRFIFLKKHVSTIFYYSITSKLLKTFRQDIEFLVLKSNIFLVILISVILIVFWIGDFVNLILNFHRTLSHWLMAVMVNIRDCFSKRHYLDETYSICDSSITLCQKVECSCTCEFKIK